MRKSFYIWSNRDHLAVTCYNPPNLRGKLVFYNLAMRDLVCNITQDCPTGCRCEDRPEQGVLNVDCRGNGLTRVPATVPFTQYNKVSIQLDNNRITTFNNVSYLSYVFSISMANNELTILPSVVMEEIANKENAIIDFRNNSLNTIPTGTQNIKFQNAFLDGNDLECSCDMLWMVEWIDLAPRYTDKSLICTFEGDVYKIIDLTESVLKCIDVGSIILMVVLSLVLVVLVVFLITAKRCPYETKVLIFKLFRIHPSDKYQVDENTDKSYDMYVSFDDNDPYVRQWVMRVLFKQLELKKPFYKLSTAVRNAPPGPEAESRLQPIDESRRLLVILSANYENHKWCEYEMCHSETLEQNEGRIIYILYDKLAEDNAQSEPWLSKLNHRKVLGLQEKMLWSKLRYELPTRALPKQQEQKHKQRQAVMHAM